MEKIQGSTVAVTSPEGNSQKVRVSGVGGGTHRNWLLTVST